VEEEARIAKAMEEVAAKLGWGQRLQLTALEAEYPHLVVPTLATLPPPPKPKPEPESSVKNALKLTSVHKKHLKKIAKELNLPEPDTALFKRFVTYANAMTESRWGHKPLDEHIRDFFSA
jgi:hypothetical protein